MIPDKYLMSHYLPNCDMMWWLDLGCMPDKAYQDIRKAEVHRDRDAHFAKLLVMNAKYYLRGTDSRLRIRELFERTTGRSADGLDAAAMFQAVRQGIDYSGMPTEFREKTNDVMNAVISKARGGTTRS